MDSSNSFTLGFPLFLFLPPLQKAAARHSSRNAFSTYMNSILIPHPTTRTALFFFFFFEREERGVFFFLHHYPGNLIHTEYNGEERGRLDRGLEEIMKFVHIQASWKVPLSLNCPLLSLQTAQPSFPTPLEKSTRLIALGEAGWEGGNTWRWSGSNLCQSVEKWREQMISIFSLASGPSTSSLIIKGTLHSDSVTAEAIDKGLWHANPGTQDTGVRAILLRH